MGKRVFLIVLDSVGAGEAPDAGIFDDAGCDTLGTCVRSGKLAVPNLEKLGVYNLLGTSFYSPRKEVAGACAKLREKSMGKDTTVGHWEIAGVVSEKPMPTESKKSTASFPLFWQTRRKAAQAKRSS